MERTINEINEKISLGKAQVITAGEAKHLIQDKGIKYLLDNTDIVVCSSFEMHSNAFLYLSFGQTDPLIYFSEAYINDVLAYPIGPADLALSVVAFSKHNNEYGGGHVLEELVKGNDVHLKTTGRILEVYPNKSFERWLNLKDLNVGRLVLNQALNQNSIVATNSGEKDINSPMGTLIAKLENSTFNSSSYLNPLINDPYCKTIGVGTKVWVSGAEGIITGQGTSHNPLQKRNDSGIPVGPAITLSCVADIKSMNPKWVRGGYIKSFGPVLYVGIGIPVPVLNEEIAKYLSITDDRINTTIVDFAIPRRTKPIFGGCAYSELRTSTVAINKKPTLSAPLASMAFAGEISKELKELISAKGFYLTEPNGEIDLKHETKKLDARLKAVV